MNLHLRCSFCMMVRTYTSATFGGSERKSITAGPSSFACGSVKPPRVSTRRGCALPHDDPSEPGPMQNTTASTRHLLMMLAGNTAVQHKHTMHSYSAAQDSRLGR